jgi:imidazolonepropionase-like amidohydrolase
MIMAEVVSFLTRKGYENIGRLYKDGVSVYYYETDMFMSTNNKIRLMTDIRTYGMTPEELIFFNLENNSQFVTLEDFLKVCLYEK